MEEFLGAVLRFSSRPFNHLKEEKLMYLQNAIKDKTAKNLIAGLTEHYDEAIKCLSSTTVRDNSSDTRLTNRGGSFAEG